MGMCSGVFSLLSPGPDVFFYFSSHLLELKVKLDGRFVMVIGHFVT
jgi:hypothetical protein